MAQVTDPTYNDAKKCPKCKQEGEFVGNINTVPQARRGTRVETWECLNDLCERAGSRWIIQINPDGTVPIRAPRGPKQFELDPKALDFGKAQVERAKYEVLDETEARERSDIVRSGNKDDLHKFDQEHGLESQ